MDLPMHCHCLRASHRISRSSARAVSAPDMYSGCISGTVCVSVEGVCARWTLSLSSSPHAAQGVPAVFHKGHHGIDDGHEAR